MSPPTRAAAVQGGKHGLLFSAELVGVELGEVVTAPLVGARTGCDIGDKTQKLVRGT